MKKREIVSGFVWGYVVIDRDGEVQGFETKNKASAEKEARSWNAACRGSAPHRVAALVEPMRGFDKRIPGR